MTTTTKPKKAARGRGKSKATDARWTGGRGERIAPSREKALDMALHGDSEGAAAALNVRPGGLADHWLREIARSSDDGKNGALSAVARDKLDTIVLKAEMRDCMFRADDAAYLAAVRGDLHTALSLVGDDYCSDSLETLREIAVLNRTEGTAPPEPVPANDETAEWLGETGRRFKREAAEYIATLGPAKERAIVNQFDPEELREAVFTLIDASELEGADPGDIGTFIVNHATEKDIRQAMQLLAPILNSAFERWKASGEPERIAAMRAEAMAEREREATDSDAEHAMARTTGSKRNDAAPEPPAEVLEFDPEFEAREWDRTECEANPTRNAARKLMEAVLVRTPTDTILTMAKVLIDQDSIGTSALTHRPSFILRRSVAKKKSARCR